MHAVHIKLWEGIQENDELKKCKNNNEIKSKNKKKMRTEEIPE